MRYPIVNHKDEGSSYGVTVPDLPGCFSGGDTLDEAFDMAREAIVGHIETLLMAGQQVPKQHPMSVHQTNPDFADGIWALVDVDLAKLSGKTIRVLAIVDEAATRTGDSRSGLLTRAVLQHIEQQTGT